LATTTTTTYFQTHWLLRCRLSVCGDVSFLGFSPRRQIFDPQVTVSSRGCGFDPGTVFTCQEGLLLQENFVVSTPWAFVERVSELATFCTFDFLE
jgi:hypothetical protein